MKCNRCKTENQFKLVCSSVNFDEQSGSPSSSSHVFKCSKCDEQTTVIMPSSGELEKKTEQPKYEEKKYYRLLNELEQVKEGDEYTQYNGKEWIKTNNVNRSVSFAYGVTYRRRVYSFTEDKYRGRCEECKYYRANSYEKPCCHCSFYDDEYDNCYWEAK